jgi:hypothetical protein
MNFLKLALALILATTVIHSRVAFAGFRHGHAYGGRYYGGHWQQGYWFHGAYLNHAGWWWVVPPYWYYYPAPLYPYPPEEPQPVYSVQMTNVPLPPQDSGKAPTAPPSAKSGTAPKAFSYYCEKSKSYYPVVSACADGWIATPVKPPN